MLQRTDEWFKFRAGKFSASDIYRLLGKEGLKKTKESINNYAFEKALDSLYGVEEKDFFSVDIERGVNLEPLAFEKFSELKDKEFLFVDECTFIPYNNHAGATPDGYVSNNSGLEIKCPRRTKFFKLVTNGFNEIDPKYIAQMQMQMLCAKTERTYFFNYFIDDKSNEYWHEILVPRDDEMIKLIEERIKIATEIKLEYIEKIKSNIQC